MKTIVISDLHGWLPKIEEPFDLLLICGDVCPAHDHYFSFQKEWIENEFVNWVNGLPFKDSFSRVVMTWGNHDFVGERFSVNEESHLRKLTGHRLMILKNVAYAFEYLTDSGINTLNIFGTPYCKIFGNWAFMVDYDKLNKKYGECPINADIIISHDAPMLNGLGLISKGHYAGTDAGNPCLDNLIEGRKPKYFFCGHIHSGNHNFEKIGETYMANASLVDESYDPTYQVLSFEIGNNKELIADSIKLLEVESQIG